jgi:hypothetical protein
MVAGISLSLLQLATVHDKETQNGAFINGV